MLLRLREPITVQVTRLTQAFTGGLLLKLIDLNVKGIGYDG